MRRKLLLVALVILGSVTVFAPRATAAVSIGVDFFYDDLAPHGRWFRMENYGWVWTPRHVAADWRPYTRGHWAYSDDYGWTWVSDEDFGWATCHYGRWFFDADYGWVWVPGDQWAPAWVSWRLGGGYAGWAPMPPDYDWQRGGYYPGGAGGLAPTGYVFVPQTNLADPVVYRHIVPGDRDDQIVRVTRDVTRYETVGDRVVNRAVPVREVEQARGRAVPRYRVEAAQTAPGRPVVHGNTVRIFRPTRQQIAQAPPARTAPPPTAVPRVKPRPAAPPANPRAAHVAPPPAPAPNAAVPRGAERQNPQARRQRQQEQERQQEAARQHEAQQQREQAQAERQRQQEQERQQEAARQRQARQQRQQAQAERQRQQEQARQQQARQQQEQQRAQALREQQAARQRAQQQREQQTREEQAKKKPKQPEPPPADKSGGR